MVFLLLAILSSAAISVLMRVSTGKVSANFTMLAVGYLVCAVLSAVYAGFDLLPVAAEGFPLTAVLGLISGAVYMGGFVLLQRNTQKNGIVLTSVFMKLGLLVPIVLALCFGETPSWLKGIGFILALGAIVLINLQKGVQRQRFHVSLLLLLLLTGCCDAMAKIFDMFAPVQLEGPYLFYTFFVAFLLCLIPVFVKKERFQLSAVVFGLCIGVPNFFASKFLLSALAQLDAIVVYPSFSVGALLLVTLTGVVVFKERLRPVQWVAVVAILAALVLLNI